MVAVAVTRVCPHRHAVRGEWLQADESDSVRGGVYQSRVGIVLIQDLIVLDHAISFLWWIPGQSGSGGAGVYHSKVLRGGVRHWEGDGQKDTREVIMTELQ